MKFAHWILGAALPLFAAGKSADDYYHGAAYKYIAGRMQEAGIDVDEGLREYPGDAHLKALSDLLKQMKDQQKQDQNQSGGGQNQDKSQQDKPQQDKSKQDSSKQSGKNGQQKQDQKKDQDSKDKKQNQDQKGQGPQPKDSSGQDQQQPKDHPEKSAADSARDSAQGGRPPKAGQMSKEDAERLLNSFQDEEKKEQRERQQPSGKRADVEQDW